VEGMAQRNPATSTICTKVLNPAGNCKISFYFNIKTSSINIEEV
jgi:hypothetical protein